MIKIKVGVPLHGTINPATYKALFKLTEIEGYQFEICILENSSLPPARNDLLKGDWDYFFGVDADIVFNNNTLINLMKSLQRLKDVNIIYAPCPSKPTPNHYECGMLHPEYPGEIKSKVSFKQFKGVQQVDWAGTGCFLMGAEPQKDGESYPMFHCPVIETSVGDKTAGEDIGFCLSMKELGLPVYVDFDINVLHVDESGLVTLKLSPQEIQSINLGLQELVHKEAEPILGKIKEQVQIQRQIISGRRGAD